MSDGTRSYWSSSQWYSTLTFCPSMTPAWARPLRNASVRRASGDPPRTNATTGIAGCCARAASGHATAAPPRSDMNSRRLMSDMGFLPPWCRSVYRTLKLTQRGRQVLGADLNCSESTADPLLCCHPNDNTQDAREDRCTAGCQSRLCPLWVISVRDVRGSQRRMSGSPQKRTQILSCRDRTPKGISTKSVRRTSASRRVSRDGVPITLDRCHTSFRVQSHELFCRQERDNARQRRCR